MRIDSHIHTGLGGDYPTASAFDRAKFMGDLRSAGIDGAVILSADPLKCGRKMGPSERMQDTLAICRGEENLFPFYWINPLEDGAAEQVQQAVDAGFDGFKMICSNYYPGCNQSMDVLQKIAESGKPVLFHSGICWDGMNSADYNRPGNFEALIEIPKLRFALAHISWPWCDECIAVYGKFNNAYYMRPETSCEMFIDVTPGTPRGYREDVFRYLFGSCYEFRYNLMFGSDCSTSKYNAAWSREWQDRDDMLYERFVEEDVEDFKEHVYCKNVMRFMGKSDEKIQKKVPMVAE
ncbi:MAG: hypothetical protein HDT20_01285 [Oscillibacter sp.]|nr:hypothetical protein [Oscillibacter sp.]